MMLSMAAGDLQSQLEQGLELRRRKKFRQAQKIFEGLASCNDSSVASRSLIELGKLKDRRTVGLVRSGRPDVEGAIASYSKAMAAGDPESSPQAACLLGEVLVRERKPAEAEKAFAEAIESGHPEWFPRAALKLARTLRQGDPGRAWSLYELVLERGAGQPATEAAHELGELCRARGDVQRAREFYARSAAMGENRSSEDWYVRLPGPRGNPDPLLQRVVARLQSTSSGFPPTLSIEDRQRLVAAGELLLVDALLVTANSKKQAIPVILTDRRIQVGGFASDYRTLLSMPREFRPRSQTKTNMGTIRQTTTHYAFTTYTLINAQGQKTVLQLSENIKNNEPLWRAVDGVVRSFIEPARAAGVVDLIRSGEKVWRIKRAAGSGDDAPLLSMGRDGFVVPIGSQPRTFAWSDQRCPVLVHHGGTSCSIRLRDGPGSTLETDRFNYAEVGFLELVLAYCQYELA
jgi:tetratricopeptide (TPR) repeat protein